MKGKLCNRIVENRVTPFLFLRAPHRVRFVKVDAKKLDERMQVLSVTQVTRDDDGAYKYVIIPDIIINVKRLWRAGERANTRAI